MPFELHVHVQWADAQPVLCWLNIICALVKFVKNCLEQALASHWLRCTWKLLVNLINIILFVNIWI